MLSFIVLMSVAVLASVQCDLKDFTDKDAFFLAQQWNDSLLEPPKALYDQIDKELAAVRKSFPEVADIQHNPILVPGKLVCFNLDYQKLNESKEFGPIRVEGIGSKMFDHDQVMITFTKPFNPMPLEEEMNKFPGNWHNGSREFGCSSVNHWGAHSFIQRSQFPQIPGQPLSPADYYFVTGNCFQPEVLLCEDKKEWLFEIDAELEAKTGEIKVKRIPLDDPHKSSTARINF